MGERAVPRVGEGSRPEANVGRGVNTAGSPELGGRGTGANGGTGVSPSRWACLTTIFTTPVLFTMVGGTVRGSYIEGKVEKDPKDGRNLMVGEGSRQILARENNTKGRLDRQEPRTHLERPRPARGK